MSRRIPKLSPQDASVVDLVCNHASGSVAKLSAIPSPRRVAAATKLLNLLDLLPDEEPPRDLTARTLQFISSSTHPLRHPEHRAVPPSARIH